VAVFGNSGRVVVLTASLVTLSFVLGFGVSSCRGTQREAILTAKYELELKRTNTDLTVSQGIASGLQESNRRMGDGLRATLERARKASSYSERARELYSGIKLAFEELGVVVE